MPRTPRRTLFPYTTLFRSGAGDRRQGPRGKGQEVEVSPSAPLLRVNNIEVIYDHVILVLKGVSLEVPEGGVVALDRKSTRLNSSHEWISYAVFCLKKKNHT